MLEKKFSLCGGVEKNNVVRDRNEASLEVQGSVLAFKIAYPR